LDSRLHNNQYRVLKHGTVAHGLILGSGVKTAISGLKRLEPTDLAEYVVDQVF